MGYAQWLAEVEALETEFDPLTTLVLLEPEDLAVLRGRILSLFTNLPHEFRENLEQFTSDRLIAILSRLAAVVNIT